MAKPDNDVNALLKVHVNSDILIDPKIVHMEPIVFTRRLNNTSFMNGKEYRVRDKKRACYVHPLQILIEQTKPTYNPRNMPKEKDKNRLDLKSYNKFVDKLRKLNKKTRQKKDLEIQKLLSSVELAFECIKAQKQQQETKLVTETNIEDNNKNIYTTVHNENEDWSSGDEENLVSLVKNKRYSPIIQSKITDKENEIVTQPMDDAIVTPTKKSGPISVIFANEGIMAIHQGTREERYDIGNDGSLGRFYIKLPPPPNADFQSVVKIVCCLYKRAKAINELLDEFVIQPSAVNFMTTIHKCPTGNCVCCCKTKFYDLLEREKIPPSKMKSSTPPLVAKAHLINAFQGRNSPNTTEFNSCKTLDELIKTLTTNFNGITLTPSVDGKLAAIFNTTPCSWDSTKIRILTDILTKIIQKLTSTGKSLQDFCQQINTMVYKRYLYSAASIFMGDKQTKSIIFMKIADINKLDTTPSNDAVTEESDVPIFLGSAQKEQETTIRKSRKRKHVDDNYYEPVVNKLQTKPTCTRASNKKWAKSYKLVSVTQLLSEDSKMKPPRIESKTNKTPKSYGTKRTANKTQKSYVTKLNKILKQAPKSAETSINTEKTIQNTLVSEPVPSKVSQLTHQGKTTSSEVSKKHPFLQKILSNNSTGTVPSDKFNISKNPIQYLVSNPVGNESVPTASNSMATLVPNECVVLSSDEEVIDLG